MNSSEASPKRGRPPLAPEERRTIVVRQRVTQAEYRALQREARAERCSVATFVRRLLLSDFLVISSGQSREDE